MGKSGFLSIVKKKLTPGTSVAKEKGGPKTCELMSSHNARSTRGENENRQFLTDPEKVVW